MEDEPIKEKKSEWIEIIDSMLNMYQISGFFYTMEKKFKKSNLNDFLMFSGNIIRVYSVTELNKIVNPDGKSLTIYSFVDDAYSKGSDQWKEFSKWKKETKTIREKIKKARNKYTSHLDRDSFSQEENFDLSIEEFDTLIKKTFHFLDYLYDNNSNLKKEFDEKINPGIFSSKPSELGKKWRKIMISRIMSLDKCCK